jgi:exonuclease SbcD
MCGHYETGIEGKTFESEMPLWVIHGYVVPRPLMFGHILIKDYPTTAKVVMAGHYHSGFPVTKRPDGVIFANPGSLGRPRSSDADHMPQACLIEIDGDAVNVEYVALKSAKPIEMAFHMELLNVEKPKGLDATDFIQTMRAATTIVADDAESLDMIEAAGKVKGVEKEVVEEAKRRILQHRGEL